jgi:hypothetical protein
VIGYGTADVLTPDVDVGRRIFLAYDGSSLIVAKDDQITWLSVRAKS